MSIETGIKKAYHAAKKRDFLEAFRMLWIYARNTELVTPDSLSLGAGTSSDALADLTTMLDGNVYELAEAAGTPGQQLTLTFVNVREIYGLLIRAYYSGSSLHYCEIQLYNYTTTAWDAFLTIESGNGFNVRYIRVPDDADYVSNNQARLRWDHPVGGNASHDAYIDYVGLEQ
jgi:hypothetical protein